MQNPISSDKVTGSNMLFCLRKFQYFSWKTRFNDYIYLSNQSTIISIFQRAYKIILHFFSYKTSKQPINQKRLGTHTKIYTMNPKACSVIELYGTLDPVTRDWTDGLLSNIFRDINKPTEKRERKYIVFDGDVDALWVENMNSVMDDNRLLTLANGERIRLQAHCALLFEVKLSC